MSGEKIQTTDIRVDYKREIWSICGVEGCDLHKKGEFELIKL